MCLLRTSYLGKHTSLYVLGHYNTDECHDRSIATWESNGRKNGFVQRELTDELLDIAERDNIRAPGMFNIPICSMVEARVNWENVYNSGSVWDNFPCDK
jgi:hypothetical protein